MGCCCWIVVLACSLLSYLSAWIVAPCCCCFCRRRRWRRRRWWWWLLCFLSLCCSLPHHASDVSIVLVSGIGAVVNEKLAQCLPLFWVLLHTTHPFLFCVSIQAGMAGSNYGWTCNWFWGSVLCWVVLDIWRPFASLTYCEPTWKTELGVDLNNCGTCYAVPRFVETHRLFLPFDPTVLFNQFCELSACTQKRLRMTCACVPWENCELITFVKCKEREWRDETGWGKKSRPAKM